MTEERSTWDEGLAERTERQDREELAESNPRPGPPADATRRVVPIRSEEMPTPPGEETTILEGVSMAERSELVAPTAEETAEAGRILKEARRRQSPGGLFLVAATMFFAAGVALIWLGTSSPGGADIPAQPIIIEIPSVSLQPPEAAPVLDEIDFDEFDEGPEPVIDDFFGPEPEI